MQKIKDKEYIRVAAVNRIIVNRNFVTGEKNIHIFSQVCRKANLMSKDKKNQR